MYGIAHVVGVDGYSRKIVSFSTMPCKNLITIYTTIFCPLLATDGIWDQVRTDHGTEFVFIATLQQYLASCCVHQELVPVLQITSRHNHRVERIWPEVNACINYPVKALLVYMVKANRLFAWEVMFSLLWVTIQVVKPPIMAL